MSEGFDHGPRLSDEEYDRRIVELHEGQPPMPTPEQDREIRRRELDLAVDHRLGIRFPQDRRDALWHIQERSEKKRLRLAFHLLLRRAAQHRADFLVREFATVLTGPELDAFFGFGGTPPRGRE